MLGVSCQIGEEPSIAEAEEAPQLALHERRADGCTRRAEGWLEIDLVLDRCAAPVVRREAVGVEPAPQGSGDLLVAETPTVLEVTMAEVPAEARRPSPDPERYLPPVADPSGALDNLDVGPRWCRRSSAPGRSCQSNTVSGA